MKLNDVYTKPLKDVVEELNLTDMKRWLLRPDAARMKWYRQF